MRRTDPPLAIESGVRDPIATFRDVMTAFGMTFERHSKLCTSHCATIKVNLNKEIGSTSVRELTFSILGALLSADMNSASAG